MIKNIHKFVQIKCLQIFLKKISRDDFFSSFFSENSYAAIGRREKNLRMTTRKKILQFQHYLS